MTTCIKAYGPVAFPEYTVNGEYVKYYDPNAFDGRGDAQFTDKLDEALKFANGAEALKFAWQVPACRPRRADGRPNRPLTAFTLEFVTL